MYFIEFNPECYYILQNLLLHYAPRKAHFICMSGWYSLSHSYFCIVSKIGPFFVTFISHNLDSKWQKDIQGLETDTIENSSGVTKCKAAFYQERKLLRWYSSWWEIGRQKFWAKFAINCPFWTRLVVINFYYRKGGNFFNNTCRKMN